MLKRQQHLVPFRRPVQVAGGDEKVGVEALVGGFPEPVVPHERHRHHVVLAKTLGHALHAGRRAPAALPPLNLHGVTPKGVGRVVLGHADLVPVGHAHEAGAHAGNLDGAFVPSLRGVKLRRRHHIPTSSQVFKLALLGQFFHERHHRPTHVVVEDAECPGDLLVVEGLAGALPKHPQDGFPQVGGGAVVRLAVHPALALRAPLGRLSVAGSPSHKLVATSAAAAFPAHDSKMRLVGELARP